MVRVRVVSSVASISAPAIVQIAARGALFIVAMSTAWAVRLLPMMAVMIATGIICLLSGTGGAPVRGGQGLRLK